METRMYTLPSLPAVHLPTNPQHFMSTNEGQAWLSRLAEAFPYAAFDRCQRSNWTLKQMNELAARVIDAKYAHADPCDVVASWMGPNSPSDIWYNEIRPDLSDYIEDRMGQAAAKNPTAAADEWTDAIYDRWAELVQRQDTSTCDDMLSSQDFCEVVFTFTRSYFEDDYIWSHRSWSEPKELAITPELQFALSKIGYSVTDFRKLSGNRHDAQSTLSRTMRNKRRILEWAGLESVIENACTSNFIMGVFAIVPVADILKIDVTSPMTFDKAWVCTLNPHSGTFHDEPATGQVTVDPADGQLKSGAHFAYSPDEICGFVTRHYHTTLRNPAA